MGWGTEVGETHWGGRVSEDMLLLLMQERGFCFSFGLRWDDKATNQDSNKAGRESSENKEKTF